MITEALKARVERIGADELQPDCWACTLLRVSARLCPMMMVGTALASGLLGLAAGYLFWGGRP